MVAAGTVALLALCTSHNDVAEALRGVSSRASIEGRGSAREPDNQSAQASAARESAALAPLALVDETRLPRAMPAAIEPAASAAARSQKALDPAPVVAPPEFSPRPHATSSGPSQATQRARALQKKGLALYLHAELDAAYAAYRQAALLAPNEAATFRGLGLAASRLGRSAEAQRALTRYLELAPAAADARQIRARLAQLISEEATRALRGGES
jgi:tetratricopeptide (TPR) repeat protein